MTYTPNVQGRIVPLDTEEGTRYALEVRGRIVSPEYPFMTEAIIFADRYGVEVRE
jgi:hypothetical protein